MNITILGAGLQGGIALTDLCDPELSPGKKQLKILNRTLEKAQALAAGFPGVIPGRVDVNDAEALAAALQDADVVINCIQYNANIDIMQACLAAKAHYIDLGGLFHITRKQFELHDAFIQAGITAVLGMGSTPGTMNVMAGYAASQLDTLTEAHAICACADFTRTAAAIGIPYSLITVMEEHTMSPWILQNGELVEVAPGSGSEKIDFGPPVGIAEARYCIHSEPAQFARSFKEKGIREASFKLSLPEDFEKKIAFLAEIGFGTDEPVTVDGQPVYPLKTMAAVVNKYLQNYDGRQDGPLNDCDVLRTVVRGQKDGIEKEIQVESVIRTSRKWGFMAGALDTGVPPSIVAQMLGKGMICRPGVYSPEQVVPPLEFFAELEKREMPVSCVVRTPLSSNSLASLREACSRPV